MSDDGPWRGEVTAPRRLISTSSAGRALAVVDDLLMEAARQGERGVAWARIFLGVAVFFIWTLLVYDELLAGHPPAWATAGVAPLGAIASLFVLRRLRRGRVTLTLQFSSVTLDAVMIACMLVPYPLYAGHGYTDATALVGTSVLVVAVAAGGARLSRRVALFGTGLQTLVLWGLLVLDFTFVAQPDLKELLFHYALYTAILLSTGVIAMGVATRTRQLVLASATQTLTAERTRQLLGAYVSEEVATASLADDELRLGGVRQDVAVLFSDLRGFTSYSEGLEPEELVRQLNRYLAVMVAAVQSQGGVVDKFMGDGIMVVFGAPTPRGDDAARALRAAATMQAALQSHNRERERRGQPRLVQGIGVHFGPVVAGNVGTTHRAAYTVVGDTVNLASRLESATKEHGTDVLFSEAALGAAGEVDVPRSREVGTVSVRGRSEPVKVFTFA